MGPLPTDQKPEPRAGWKTTEFWVTVLPLVLIGTLLLTGTITVEDVLKLWPLLVGGGAYAISRGQAKS